MATMRCNFVGEPRKVSEAQPTIMIHSKHYNFDLVLIPIFGSDGQVEHRVYFKQFATEHKDSSLPVVRLQNMDFSLDCNTALGHLRASMALFLYRELGLVCDSVDIRAHSSLNHAFALIQNMFQNGADSPEIRLFSCSSADYLPTFTVRDVRTSAASVMAFNISVSVPARQAANRCSVAPFIQQNYTVNNNSLRAASAASSFGYSQGSVQPTLAGSVAYNAPYQTQSLVPMYQHGVYSSYQPQSQEPMYQHGTNFTGGTSSVGGKRVSSAGPYSAYTQLQCPQLPQITIHPQNFNVQASTGSVRQRGKRPRREYEMDEEAQNAQLIQGRARASNETQEARSFMADSYQAQADSEEWGNWDEHGEIEPFSDGENGGENDDSRIFFDPYSDELDGYGPLLQHDSP